MSAEAPAMDDDLDGQPEEGGIEPSEQGLRVPLPLLFITLMILVIFSVFDILDKSYDASVAANNRVANVVYKGALSRANTELDGLALELVSGLAANRKDLDTLAVEGLGGSRSHNPRDALTVFRDSEGKPLMVFMGAEAIGGLEQNHFRTGLQLRSGGSGEQFVSLGGQVYMLSAPHELAGGTAGRAASVVVGMPADKLLVSELEHYDIFRTGSLKQMLEGAHRNGFEGLSGLIVEIQGAEYGRFRASVLAQFVTVLVTFVICVMIARRIDEKNDALRRSYALLAKGRIAEEEARRAALLDPVTGIGNRKAFDEFLQIAVRDSARRDETFVLALLDLDDFKQVNDAFGHLTGDQALRHVGDRISHSVRQTDLAARLGGDEFAVILRDVRSAELAEELVGRILHKVSAPFEARGNMIEIGISAGLSVYPADAGTGEQIFTCADKALYAAKQRGKNQLCSWPPDSADTGAPKQAKKRAAGRPWISRFVKNFM